MTYIFQITEVLPVVTCSLCKWHHAKFTNHLITQTAFFNAGETRKHGDRLKNFCFLSADVLK